MFDWRAWRGSGNRAPPGWTPADADVPPVHWHYPADQSTLSLTAALVDSASDKAGGALSLSKISDARRGSLNTTTGLLNDLASIEYPAAAGAALRCATGGLLGNVDHTLYGVAQFLAPIVAQRGTGIMFGTEGLGTSHFGYNGTAQNNAWWAANSASATPASAGSIINVFPHMFAKRYTLSAQRTEFFVDDIRLINATSLAYNLTAGLTVGPWNVGFPCDFRAWSAIWRPGADAAALMLQHSQWAARTFGLFVLIGAGDSVVLGYNSGAAPNDLITKTAALLPATTTRANFGVVGDTMAAILARQPGEVTTLAGQLVSGQCGIPQVVLFDGIVNNITIGDSDWAPRVAAGLADFDTYVANNDTAGQISIPYTLPDAGGAVPVWYQAAADVANAGIIARYEAGDFPALVRLDGPGFARGADDYHFSDVGNAAAAVLAAAAVRRALPRTP